MANDLETMRQRLRDVLFDTDDATWNAGEKDDILYMAVNRLSRRIPRPINPADEATDITLETETYTYDLGTYTSITKILLSNSSGDQIGYLESGWEVIGDLEAGYADLYVSPRVVESYVGGTLRLIGYGRYTLNTLAEEIALSGANSTCILDEHVPLVLAWAQEAAWRRLLSDRARFRQWQNANQTQNVSVNEIVQMISDASRQADEEWALRRRFQSPVIGRI